MINFEEELAKFKPSLEVDETEKAILNDKMVDITDIPDVKLEDTVTLIGRDGENYISVEDMANLAGSFNYEFVCDISERVERKYV